jgi:hypothetical protein
MTDEICSARMQRLERCFMRSWWKRMAARHKTDSGSRQRKPSE